MVPEEEIEASGYESEASTTESGEEYSVEEEEVIDIKELNPHDIELMLKRSELWDQLVAGTISIEEAKKIISELAPAVSVQATARRRRRRS